MASRFWSTTATSKLALRILICFTFSFVCSSAFAAKDLQPHITFNRGKIEIVGAKSKTKNRIITVEFAESEAQQQKGLMYRDTLPKDEGMLFLFDSERTLGFWMRNTYIDLDIAYIDKNFKIVDIQQMKATTSLQVEFPSYPSKKPAQYALEMNENWFQKHKFKVGDLIRIVKN